MKEKLLVVGFPRGGTSFFTACLREMGLKTVRDDREHPDYPSGFGEHMPLLLFAKMCERLRGNRNRLTMDPIICKSFLEHELVRLAWEEASKPFFDESIDFLKVPAFALAHEFLMEEVPDLRIIGVVREPASAMRSFYAREFGRWKCLRDRLTTVGCWNMYAMQMLDMKERYPDRVSIVSVDRLAQGKIRLESTLENILGRPFPVFEIEKVLKKKWRSDGDSGWRLFYGLLEQAAKVSNDPRTDFFFTDKHRKALEEVSVLDV